VALDILPDSRTRARTGIIRTDKGDYVPIFCASCGKPQGMVPARLITHVTALCDTGGCAEKYGNTANALLMDPDGEYRIKLGEEITKLGRPVTVEELDEMVRHNDVSPALAALFRDWQVRVSKENR
jgi:hypothetical protein